MDAIKEAMIRDRDGLSAAAQKPIATKRELIEAFDLGGMGEVEFFELAMEIGMNLDETALVMQRAKDDWV